MRPVQWTHAYNKKERSMLEKAKRVLKIAVSVLFAPIIFPLVFILLVAAGKSFAYLDEWDF